MRLLIALLVLAAATTGFSCKGTRRAQRQQLVQNQDSLLYGNWYRSYEDDKGGDGSSITWRPDTYKFPPSRGREGLSFMAGGKFGFLGIAPTDGTELRPGTWGWSGPKTLRISLEDGTQYVIVIQSLTREKLVGRMDRQ